MIEHNARKWGTKFSFFAPNKTFNLNTFKVLPLRVIHNSEKKSFMGSLEGAATMVALYATSVDLTQVDIERNGDSRGSAISSANPLRPSFFPYFYSIA